MSPYEGAKFQDRAGEFFKNHIIDLAIFVAICAYMFKALAEVEILQKDIWKVILETGLFTAVGLIIKFLMMKRGIMMGLKDANYMATMTAFGEQLIKISNKIEYLGEFCEEVNEENMRQAKKDLLLNYGFTWEQYQGKVPVDEWEQADFEKCKKRMKHLKVYKIKKQVLTSESGEKRFRQQYSLGKNIHSFETVATSQSIIWVIVFGLFSTYVGFNFIEGVTLGTIISAVVQGAVMLLLGVWSLWNGYVFITQDFRNRIIMKTNYLNEFDNLYTENGKKGVNVQPKKEGEKDEPINGFFEK